MRLARIEARFPATAEGSVTESTARNPIGCSLYKHRWTIRLPALGISHPAKPSPLPAAEFVAADRSPSPPRGRYETSQRQNRKYGTSILRRKYSIWSAAIPSSPAIRVDISLPVHWIWTDAILPPLTSRSQNAARDSAFGKRPAMPITAISFYYGSRPVIQFLQISGPLFFIQNDFATPDRQYIPGYYPLSPRSLIASIPLALSMFPQSIFSKKRISYAFSCVLSG